ncbi:MAG: beta-ketoacyl-ACP synthase 3 [Planctomycetaceae bacterium]|nr:beta-ketoacyl-ACP synthase 3 [Planctomycetaceae bacterium]
MSAVTNKKSHPQSLGTNPRNRILTTGSIAGTGISVPSQIIPNSYFEEELGLKTSDAWIQQRIGIFERRFARPEETTSQFAAAAARQALESANCSAKDIDLILVATSTPEFVMPATACLVQQELEASNASAFDLNSACAGFAVAMDVAVRYLQSGMKNILIIGVDLGSRLVDMQDRSTCVFFGDGAGALVLSSQGPGKILASQTTSAGNAEPLQVPIGGKMSMDGRAIWDFATDIIPKTIFQLCEAAQISAAQLDLIVPHQANRNILEQAAKSLGMHTDQFAINIQKYGNTMAASIPIALHEAFQDGKAVPGTYMAIVGFGAGLTWGGTLLQL